VLLAAWLPLQALLAGTGGTASPFLPLVVVWAALLAPLGARAAAIAGGAALALLLAPEAARGELAAPLEATLAVTGGVLLAGWRAGWGGTRPGARDREARGTGVRAAGVGEPPAEELAKVLERTRRASGAVRAVLWEVDAAADRLRVRAVRGGMAPPAVPLRGNPLQWVVEEGAPLRLEGPPRWPASGPVGGWAAVAVGHDRPAAAVLTLEFAPGAAGVSIDALADAGGYLSAVYGLAQAEQRAALTRARFLDLLGVLRALAAELEPSAYARALADAVCRMVGGTGAALARWDGRRGVVVTVVGEDGGPEPGASFTVPESELALALAAGTALIRADRPSARVRTSIVAPGERWTFEPRSLAIIPLPDGRGGIVGGVAAWSLEPGAFDEEAVAVAEAIAPYAGLQLGNAERYGEAQRRAERDALTGLWNRRALEAQLAREAPRVERYGRPLSLLLLDIDHFKRINDEYGHPAGDAALRTLAALLQSLLRETDTAARYGGEEFVVLLPETPLAAAAEVAERLRRTVEQAEFEWEGKRIPLRVSLGVSSCPECVNHPDDLIASADAMLYASKTSGRNRVSVAARRG